MKIRKINYVRQIRNAHRFGIVICLFCVTFACAHPPGTFQLDVPEKRSENPLLFLYQGPLDHLSAVRRGQCPMYPSCSEYAREAFEKYGFLKGAVMMFDRLIRCGRDELNVSPLIYTGGEMKCYDPVDRNRPSGSPG